MREPRVPPGLRAFITKYQPSNAVVVTRDLVASIVHSGCRINFVPAYLLN